MAIELTALWQHADNIVGGNPRDDKQIFINDQGGIADRSGLGFFKRHFSSSARMEENHATLQAFWDAIAANPKYQAQLETVDVAAFFQTKHAQGIPLTARDVRMVKNMLEMERIAAIGGELAELGLNLNVIGFAWFCTGQNLNIDSVEDSKEALKAYYTSQHCNAKARQALTAEGVPPEKLDAALKILQASAAWSSALDSAFEGNVRELTHDLIMDRFGSALEQAAGLLSCMVGWPDMDNRFLMSMASERRDEARGISLFNGTLEAISGGAIAVEEGPSFMTACRMENWHLGVPELRNTAIGQYLTRIDAARRFMALATDNGLPEGVGKALAYHPEFLGRMGNAQLVSFPPPTIPTRAQVDALIERTAAEFLTEKNEAIRSLLARRPGDCAPVLAAAAGEISEKSICELLNPLLAGPALVLHLLDAEKGTDAELIRHLENFQAALVSCQHMVEGEFGADDLYDVTKKFLPLLMVTMNANENTLERLLASINRNFSVIGPGLSSVSANLRTNKLRSRNVNTSFAAISLVQNAMRRLAGFAHSMTSPAQRESLGIHEEADNFVIRLEQGPNGGVLPLADVHQSVRAFVQARGIQIPQKPYAETNALADSEADAFTGSETHPVVTDLLRERAGIIAHDLGLGQLNPADLDPVSLGSGITKAIRQKKQELLSPIQARAISEQAIREYLQELKPAMDFIAGLPTEHNPDVPGQFVITPAEKQRLLQLIPGIPIRYPELIKAVLLESRALVEPLKALSVPGLSRDDMVQPLMKTVSRHQRMTGSFQVPKDLAEELARKITNAEQFAAYRAAMALAVDALQLRNDQALGIFEKVSGDEGLELGRSFTRMADLCVSGTPSVAAHQGEFLNGIKTLDNLRMILGPRVGEVVGEDAFYYTYDQELDLRDIPASVFEAASNILNFRSTGIPGYGALAAVSPRLTHEEWDVLLPILQTIGKSIEDHFDHALALKMVAANARELLAVTATNRGRPLTPAQIWQTVMGNQAPANITAANLGAVMFDTAANRISHRVAVWYPNTSMEHMTPLIKYSLGSGIPFQSLYHAYQAGGRLGMADLRLDSPALSSLSDYTANNAYGLVTDWCRRASGTDGTPSLMIIHSGDGGGFAIEHRSLPHQENTPDNPIFTKIMDRCRSISRSELQFQRVMQSLSQASTINLRILSECFPGQQLSEHSHFDSTVTPQPNGDIIVALANAPNDRPWGAHIQISVTPEGEATVTDIGLELRG